MVSEEKKGTLQDVANQKGVVCRAQGWKMHLCAAQLMQLVRNNSLLCAVSWILSTTKRDP
jgi:hypothetical protein